MIETCPKCGSIRTESKYNRSLENTTRQPCSKCYDWVEQFYESEEDEET